MVILGDFMVQRSRTKKGRYKGDKKSTKGFNEAWVGGKAPWFKKKWKKFLKWFKKHVFATP